MTTDPARPPAAALALRAVLDADLPVFFEHQQDREAVFMAAFTPRDPADRAAFDAHWARIRADPAVLMRTILVEGRVAGHIASFTGFGEREVTYWLGRAYWGRGLATRALREFLKLERTRPLYGRAGKDNLASVRVLEKCGFVLTGEDRGFANARGAEVAEVILTLSAPADAAA